MESSNKSEVGGNGAAKALSSERGLWVVFAFLCVVALVLAGALIAIRVSSDGDSGDTDNAVVDEDDANVDEVVDGTDELDSNEEVGGDGRYVRLSEAEIQEYVKEMDAKIESAASNEEKRDLYVERALNMELSELEEKEAIRMALDDLYKAEELAPSIQTALWIYYYEDRSGNSERATEYMQKAKDRGYEETEGEG